MTCFLFSLHARICCYHRYKKYSEGKLFFLCICLVKPIHDIMNYINNYIQKEKESSTFLSHNLFFLIVLLCSSQRCKLCKLAVTMFFYKQSVALMTWWGETREACHFFSNLTRKTRFGNLFCNKTNPCYFMNSNQNH